MRQIVFVLSVVLLSLAVAAPLQAQWAPTAQLPEKTIFGLAANGASLFAATDSNLYRTRNGGMTWELASPAMVKRPVHVLASNGAALFAATSNNLFRSTDDGITWVSVGRGLEDDYFHIVNILQLVPLGGANLLALNSGNGLFRSSDNGASWSRGTLVHPTYSSIVSLGADASTAFAGTDDWNVAFSSSDGGATWRQDWASLPAWNVMSVEVVGTTVIVGTSGGGMYRSAGPGTPWYLANDGMPGPELYGQFPFDVNVYVKSGRHLFVGTTMGVYMSSDTGGTWTSVNAGLGTGRNTYIISLAILGKELYAGTAGFGVWRRPLSEIVTSAPGNIPDELPAGFILYQNYPNPFNPSTMIRYQVPLVSEVRLSVHDMLGREVAVLTNEVKQPGSYTVQLDGSRLASGTYFYQLRAGSYVDTKKFTLVR